MENKKNITKANERKALEQIKQIVESIGGENSYVGMAFKGAFELAEENIKHDFWGAALDWQEEMKRQDGLMRQTEAELIGDFKRVEKERDTDANGERDMDELSN